MDLLKREAILISIVADADKPESATVLAIPRKVFSSMAQGFMLSDTINLEGHELNVSFSLRDPKTADPEVKAKNAATKELQKALLYTGIVEAVQNRMKRETT